MAPRYPSSSRYTHSISRTGERTATPVGYTNSDRLRSPSVKIPSNFKEECKRLPLASGEIAAEKPSQFDNSQVTKSPEVSKEDDNCDDVNNCPQFESVTLTVISRGTSPGPPASSSFVRNRRAEAARLIQKEITRLKGKSETKDAEIQSDKTDDCSTRYSRFASGRVWPSYVDKYPSSGSYSRNYGPRMSSYGYGRQSSDSGEKSQECGQEENKTKRNEVSSPSKNFEEPSPQIQSDSSNTLNPLSKSELNGKDRNNEILKSETSSKPSCIVKAFGYEPPADHNLPQKDQKKPSRKYTRALSQKLTSHNHDRADHRDNSPSDESKVEKQIKKRGGSVSSTASSEGGAKSISRNSSTKSLNQQRQMTRTDSSDSSVSVPTGRSRASSAPSHQAKIRTNGSPSSVSSCKVNSIRTSGSEARGKPPVPKCEVNANMRSSPVTKYVNKDFRKSALNMPDASEAVRLQYERKRGKKMQRSVSASSQDSESNNSDKSSRRASNAISDSKSSSGQRLGLQRSRSGSKVRRKNSSSGSSDSSSGSSSDDEVSGSKRIRKRISNSPKMERKRAVSGDSSRTSALPSSADELSLNTEKPPRPASSGRSRSEKSAKSEDAKSFLIRTLTPVTNFFKNKEETEGDETFEGVRVSGSPSVNKSIASLGNSLGSSKENSCDRTAQGTLRHQSSGEKPWWMDSNSENVPEGVERMSVCQDEISEGTTVSTNLPDDGKNE